MSNKQEDVTLSKDTMSVTLKQLFILKDCIADLEDEKYDNIFTRHDRILQCREKINETLTNYDRQ